MTFLTPARGRDFVDVPRSTWGWTLFGICFLGAFALTFGVWANMAEIAGAVVAPGVFVATGDNKTIQHLEGGVIRRILVHEGDVVEPGQVLIELDDTVAKAELRRLTLQEDRLLAITARLAAEEGGGDELQFPVALSARAAGDPSVAAMLSDQREAFFAHNRKLRSELAVLKDQVEALNQRIAGSQVQEQATKRQLGLLAQETDAKRTLLSSGLARKPEVLALERATASGEGEVGRLDGDIGTAREEIARTRQQMMAGRDADIKSIVDDLQTESANLNDVRERIRAARDILHRTSIRAPVKGIVVKLRYHTTGGVIEAGREIMEIVPLDAPLLIEVHVRPQDIEFVKQGELANVRLTALNQRVTPMVQGKVIYVSADALPEDRRGVPITSDLYVVRIRLDPADAARLHFSAVPGMPAEVYIKTAERTFFEYVTRPIRDSMSRAFREP